MEYSAGNVSNLLWFVEMRETAKLLQNHDVQEVQRMVVEEKNTSEVEKLLNNMKPNQLENFYKENILKRRTYYLFYLRFAAL